MTQADQIVAVISDGARTVAEISAATGLDRGVVRVVLNRYRGRFINIESGRARAGRWGLLASAIRET